MKTLLNDINQAVNRAQSVARSYHLRTQHILSEADRIATRIHKTIHSKQYPRNRETRRRNHYRPHQNESGTHSYDYLDTTTTSRLKQIIDGQTDREWPDRLDTFTEELRGTHSDVNTAYLHGYLDAQSYLKENHPAVKHRFHKALRYDFE